MPRKCREKILLHTNFATRLRGRRKDIHSYLLRLYRNAYTNMSLYYRYYRSRRVGILAYCITRERFITFHSQSGPADNACLSI